MPPPTAACHVPLGTPRPNPASPRWGLSPLPSRGAPRQGGSAPSWGLQWGAQSSGRGTPTPPVPLLWTGTKAHKRQCHCTVTDVPELRLGGRIGVWVALSPLPPPPAKSRPRCGGKKGGENFLHHFPRVTVNSNFPKVTGWLCQRVEMPPPPHTPGCSVVCPPHTSLGRVRGGPRGTQRGWGRGCPLCAPQLPLGHGGGPGTEGTSLDTKQPLRGGGSWEGKEPPQPPPSWGCRTERHRESKQGSAASPSFMAPGSAGGTLGATHAPPSPEEGPYQPLFDFPPPSWGGGHTHNTHLPSRATGHGRRGCGPRGHPGSASPSPCPAVTLPPPPRHARTSSCHRLQAEPPRQVAAEWRQRAGSAQAGQNPRDSQAPAAKPSPGPCLYPCLSFPTEGRGKVNSPPPERLPPEQLPLQTPQTSSP